MSLFHGHVACGVGYGSENQYMVCLITFCTLHYITFVHCRKVAAHAFDCDQQNATLVAHHFCHVELLYAIISYNTGGSE